MSKAVLQVVRDPGPAKIDKIILLYRYTDASNPRDAFKDENEPGRAIT